MKGKLFGNIILQGKLQDPGRDIREVESVSVLG